MTPFIRKLNIGGVELKNSIILAPMAGFTDVAFRRLCRECGAALTVTEMVSVNGLAYGNAKTRTLLKLSDVESPCAVQLFGSRPETFAQVLAGCESLSGFDIVDINMGCPMPKVTSLGAGSALLSDIVRASEIVDACVESARGRAVTVKMRLGITDSCGAEKFACEMERAGAAAITVHGRTAKQLYGGLADWDAISKVKKAVGIPVIGNGDIASVSDLAKAEKSLVDGVSIGRGALGNPMLFECLLGAKTGLTRRQAAIKHVEYMDGYFGSAYAAVNFRKHAGRYLHGEANSRDLKLALTAASDVSEVKRLLESGV